MTRAGPNHVSQFLPTVAVRALGLGLLRLIGFCEIFVGTGREFHTMHTRWLQMCTRMQPEHITLESYLHPSIHCRPK